MSVTWPAIAFAGLLCGGSVALLLFIVIEDWRCRWAHRKQSSDPRALHVPARSAVGGPARHPLGRARRHSSA